MPDTIKKLKKEIEKLKKLAHHDELTGLLNRHGFREEADKFLGALAEQHGFKKRKSFLIENFGLVIFDIDNFKKLNDVYGHAAGDEALMMFAKIIKDRKRDIDLAARWGGEEVVLGLVGASVDDSFNAAEDIRKILLERFFIYRGEKVRFTASAGVADAKMAKDFKTMFDLADKALYKAKKLGRNQTQK